MPPLGIRREDKNPFERRVPLIPRHAARLIAHHDQEIQVQPSPRRIFEDQAFATQGARITEDLDACPVIMGVKEIPIDQLLANKTYVFFSHTIKGQPYNMPLLRQILDLGCTLIDYERIVDDHGRRLVFFGRHAGLAGMIDTLWALGQRLAHEGLSTPFSTIQQTHAYADLEHATQDLTRVGAQIRAEGLPSQICPLVFGVTGYGNVSVGAQEILDLLGPRSVTPDHLLLLSDDDPGLYQVVFHEHHLARPHRGDFELQDYYDHPERYQGIFSRYLDRLSVLVNCIYWEPRYPKLVTLKQLETLYGESNPRLKVIGDISCDVGGSIEATLKATEPDNPVFVYDLDQRQGVDGVTGRGPVIMAVDNLPAELPREASDFFSTALMPFLPQLATADFSVPFDRCQLPEPIRRAVIAYRGVLTPDYDYLSQHLSLG